MRYCVIDLKVGVIIIVVKMFIWIIIAGPIH